MSLKRLKEKVHEKVLNARNIEHLVATPAFTLMYYEADYTQAKQILMCIKTANHKKLKEMLQTSTRDLKPLESMTARELRSLASSMNIPYYTHKPSSVLINEIEEKQNVR